MALELVDISNNDGTIDWQQVTGVAGVLAKATEGRTFNDPMFGSYRAAAERRGLRFGAYHFARPSNQPGVDGAQSEAQHLLAVIRAVTAGELPPTLDLEDPHATGPLDEWVAAWLRTVEQATGRVPIIYTYWSYWCTHITDRDRFKRYPLWVAAYQSSAPKIPQAWTFWQHTDHGRIPGITPDVDLDTFNGTQADLDRLAGLGQAPAPHPEDNVQQVTLPATPDGVPVDVHAKALDGSDVIVNVARANVLDVTATTKAEVWKNVGQDGKTYVHADPACDVDVTYR